MKYYKNRTSSQQMFTFPVIESHYDYSHLMFLNPKLINFSSILLWLSRVFNLVLSNMIQTLVLNFSWTNQSLT